MFKRLIKSTLLRSPKEKMIQYVTGILSKKNNKNIRATISGFDSPKRAIRKSTGEAYIPEVTAEKGGQLRLFAVETKDSLNQEELEARWKLFSDCAKQNDALFYIVFPQGMVATIKDKLEEFDDIEANLWQAAKR